jgi:hypothetical protein
MGRASNQIAHCLMRHAKELNDVMVWTKDSLAFLDRPCCPHMRVPLDFSAFELAFCEKLIYLKKKKKKKYNYIFKK